MKKLNGWIKSLLCATAMLAAVCLLPSAAQADKVTLKDGKVIEGTITKEVDGYIWIKTSLSGIEQTMSYAPELISKVERDTPAAKPADAPKGDGKPTDSAPGAGAAAGAAATSTTPAAHKPGVTKGAVITLGDETNGHMVGVFMTGEILHRAIPALEQELGTDHSGIVVFRVHSGGGYGSEVQKIADVITKEYATRWRTVAWIDTAISAAAMSSHCIREIYFTTQGNYGACVGFYGSLDKPVEGIELQKSLAEMEKISDLGGYDRRIMRAMQVQDPLSAVKDENGDIKILDGTGGDFVVNAPGDILTFNANTALRVKFSKGTADSLDQLTKLMGYQEIEWVGKKEPHVPWPVCKAEKMQMDFRKQVKEDENRTNEYFRLYGIDISVAQGTPKAERAPFVGKARAELEKIKNMVKNNPAFARNLWGGREQYKKWLEEQEKILRDLMK